MYLYTKARSEDKFEKRKKLPCEICAGLVVVTATCNLDVGMHSSANLDVAGDFEMQGQKANWRVIARAIDDGERGRHEEIEGKHN
jgi:hypothetical protein